MALGKMTFSNGLFWPVLVGKSRHGHRDILPDRPQHCHAVYALHKRIGWISTADQGSVIFFMVPSRIFIALRITLKRSVAF